MTKLKGSSDTTYVLRVCVLTAKAWIWVLKAEYRSTNSSLFITSNRTNLFARSNTLGWVSKLYGVYTCLIWRRTLWQREVDVWMWPHTTCSPRAAPRVVTCSCRLSRASSTPLTTSCRCLIRLKVSRAFASALLSLSINWYSRSESLANSDMEAMTWMTSRPDMMKASSKIDENTSMS